MSRPLRILSWSGVGVLAAGLCLAAVSAVSSASRSAECVNNLKNLALALNTYASGTGGGCFPFATLPNERLPPERRLSWMVELYKGSFYAANLVLVVDESLPWDAEKNLRPVVIAGRKKEGQTRFDAREFPLCVCPSDPAGGNAGLPNLTSYVGISGLGRDAATLPLGNPSAGVFGYDRRTRERDIRDGTGVTMLVVETTRHNGPWTAGGSATVRGLDPGHQPYLGRGRQFGGNHRGGLNVAFADGSVRFLRETIDPKVFEALSTIAGGERLSTGWER